MSARKRKKRRPRAGGAAAAGRPEPAERRPTASGAPAPRRPAPVPRSRATLAEAPPAPWSPFPLVELTILIGIVLVVCGFAGLAERRGLFLGCGFALISLASLELAIREHFAGYRSHSALLAGATAVIVAIPLFLLTRLPQVVLLGVGVVVFAGVLLALRAAFRRRTGGAAFRA